MAATLLTDALWDLVEPFLPIPPRRPNGGRPRVPDRAGLTGILFVLRSGLPWQMLPQELGCGAGMTCWRRLRDWQLAGVWDLIHFAMLDWLARHDQIDWSRAVVDSCSVRAVYGGTQTGPNPTRSCQARKQAPSDLRRARRTARRSFDRCSPARLERSVAACRCDSLLQGERGRPRSRPDCVLGDRAYMQKPSGQVSGRVRSCPCWPSAAPSTGAAWAGVGGSWSARLPGSVSFAACACGMTSGPTSTRPSFRSGVR